MSLAGCIVVLKKVFVCEGELTLWFLYLRFVCLQPWEISGIVTLHLRATRKHIIFQPTPVLGCVRFHITTTV